MGLFDKLKRGKNNLTIDAIIGEEYEQQYFDDYSYFCDFISGKLTEQPIFSEVEKQEINLIMAYIKECGTYAQKFYSGKKSKNNVDMEKIAYVNDNLYDRICDKIGRLHKENGEPLPYEKNDDIVR